MRNISAGSHLKLWLNDSPFPFIRDPESILEHSVPAKPANQEQARHATLRYTGGHENDNIMGADFTPNNSDELIIRIPVGGTGDQNHNYEGLWQDVAQRIMSELVVAGYLGVDAITKLGSGVLDFNRTCARITYSRGHHSYPGQAMWLLTLLSPDTEALSDEDIIHRMFEVGAIQLTKKHIDAASYLLEALEDKALFVRYRALELLGQVKSSEAVPVLLEKFNQDSSLLGKIAITLGSIGDHRAILPLIASLNDNSVTASAKKNIILALGALKDTQAIEPLLQHFRTKWTAAPDDSEWSWYIQTLLSVFKSFNDSRVVSTLIDFAQQVTDRRVKHLTINALVEIGDSTVAPLLIGLIGDEDESIRNAAVHGLAQIGDGSAVQPLISSLQDKPAKSTASYIINALGRLQDMLAWTTLVNILKMETDNDLCCAAANALVMLDNVQAERLLMPLLKSDRTEQHLAALDALSSITTPEIIRALSDCLPTAPQERRLQVIRKWNASGNLNTVPALLALLRDQQEEPKVRSAAADALGNLKAKDAVPQLLSLIDHQDTAIVASVIDALGKIADHRAILKLIDKLYDDRVATYLSHRVYDWAEIALRKIGTPECIQAMNEAFRKRNSLKQEMKSDDQ